MSRIVLTKKPEIFIQKVLKLVILSFLFILAIGKYQYTSAQCSLYSNPGNNVESPPQLCAPHDFEWRVWYTISGAPGTVEFDFLWGDSPVPEVLPGTHLGGGVYEVTATHIYPRGGDQCSYIPSVQVRINGVPCPNSIQTQNVTVWDVDNQNGGELVIDPEVYRVCVGEDATVNFIDNSIWNCTPASGAFDRMNTNVRWLQWVYGTGAAGDRLDNVEVDGTVRTYDYEGDVQFIPGPNIASGIASDQIYVPTTTVADLGKQFEVTLRYWNVCNPYDADTTDGDFLNPVTVGGDSAFISRTARIIVVEKSDPNFQTRLENETGPTQTEFCIDEQIFFENMTAGIDDDADGQIDSDLRWEWEFYDDETGTILLETKTRKNPSFTYTTPGRKMIRLTANDQNSIYGAGNTGCGGQIVKYVDILSTPFADIQTTDTNGNPLGNLCYDPAAPQNFEINFTDISTDFDPVTSTWEWNFYSHDGSDYLLDSIKSGSGTQETFTANFTQPGMYMTELVSSAIGVNCETRDTAYVNIYEIPSVDFTADPLCADDSTGFVSIASLGQSINGDQISLYEWDLNYDGVTFNVDHSSASPDEFRHKLGGAGTYRVAHRVSTSQGSCSSVIEKDIIVLPSPDVSFSADQIEGCSPLEVTFSMNTLIADQPAGVSEYEWFVRDLSTNIVTSQVISPGADTYSYTFTNDLPNIQDHEYEIWVEASTTNSCDVISQPDTIRVFSGPQSDFEILNLSGLDTNCSPRTYDFRVSSSVRNLNPDAYIWRILDLDDSTLVNETTLSGTEPNFSYTLLNETNTVKKFSVELLASKSGFCFSPTQEIVDVNPKPDATFYYEIINADCDFVTYQVTANQAGLNYSWSLHPQPLNTPDLDLHSFEITYAKSANSGYPVSVSLITENLVGCESLEETEQITIDPQENIGANFSVDPTITEITENTINIYNNTNPGNWDYYWDFGDGNTSVEANPGSHTYEVHGTYWIKMRAEGQYCFEEDSAQVIVNMSLPEIDFSFTSIEGCLPLEVTFYNQTQFADSSTFRWDFGNGDTSTEVNPVYTYRESGIYTVTLEASNDLGVTVRAAKEIIVDLDQGPVSDFRIRLAQAYLPGQEISFFNQSQRSEFYYWDFGDGTTTTQEEPSHVYEEVGEYEIMLITSNSIGCADTTIQQIFIEPFHPEVDFTYEPPKGCRPLTVQFRNLSRFAQAGTFRWSFGEGEGVSTEENPTYTYYQPGLYTVTLEASNSNGITGRSVKEFSVEVYDTPRASFNLRPQESFLGEPIYFVNLSVGGEKYYWDFGDGNTSTEFDPAHTYEETGVYDVTLVVESDKGCTDTLTMASAAIVKNGGKVNVPNAFTPNTSGPGVSDAFGAGKNDVFLPVFEGVTSFHFMIYNRWGELLFESYDKSYGWDGYYKGKLCAMDVYVYKLELEFSNGKSNTIVGDVSLIR